MAAQRKSFQLYFGKRDQDLWEALQGVEEGDRNHEIRTALRAYFLGEGITPVTQTGKSIEKEMHEEETKEENALDHIGLIGGGMIR